MKVAVIGAGIAGISCASALQRAGIDVTLFDKARGPGGRMTSKHTELGYMDFGAQYFTARHPLFQQQVALWQQQGLVSRWLAPLYQYQQQSLLPSPDEQQRYIGTPAMHSPLKWEAKQIKSYYNCRISRLTRLNTGWQLTTEQADSFDGFTQVIIALPPVQAAELLPQEVALALPKTLLQPCWAVSIVLAKPTAHPAGGIFVKDQQLGVSWISRHNSKPGRVHNESWLVHFTPAYSQKYLQHDAHFWQEQAAAVLSGMLQQPLEVAMAVSHRWLYAQLNPEAIDDAVAIAAGPDLWLAGDWTRGGRVENAWLSGYEIATTLIANRQV